MERILLVSHELTVTGAPNSLLRQAIYFRDAGYAVDVWTLADGALRPRYEEEGFHPECVEDSRRELLAKYKKNPVRYALVICNTIRTYRAVDVLSRRQLKVAWFIRETKLLDEEYWFNPDFANLFKAYYNLWTVSEYSAAVIRRYNPNVRVIRNAVADRFRGFAPLTQRTRFGFIGSFVPEKGLAQLLEAFRNVRIMRDDVDLIIAGRSPKEMAERFQRETADDPCIRWLGEVQGEAKQAFFDSIDVLCVPSHDEPSGLTVIEGAMQGKLVVTTDRTGANYMVDQGSGRIVPADNELALTDTLMTLAGLDRLSLRTCQGRSRANYRQLGAPDAERAAVLAMPGACGPAPKRWSRMVMDDQTPLWHETHYEDGTRQFYLFNIRLFTKPGPGVLKR